LERGQLTAAVEGQDGIRGIELFGAAVRRRIVHAFL
jgi:hypothetical protein